MNTDDLDLNDFNMDETDADREESLKDYAGESDEPIVQTTEKKSKKKSGNNSAFKDWMKKFGELQANAVEREGYKEAVQTGIPTFDVAMGTGGLPLGSLVTLYGKEGTGKTAFWQHIVGCVQRQYPKKKIMIFDSETSVNAVTAERNGMSFAKELFDNGSLFFYTPDLDNGISYERAMMMIERMITPNDKGELAAPDGVFAVIDSLDSMMTQAEMEMDADSGGAKFGAMAKAGSVTIKRVKGRLKATNSTLLVVQQARAIVSTMPTYGPPGITTSGGYPWKHEPQVRIEFQVIKSIKSGDSLAGVRVRGKMKKNKFNTPGEFEADLRFDWSPDYNAGWDRAMGLIETGLRKEVGLVVPAGKGVEFVGFSKSGGDAAVFAGGRAYARDWLNNNHEKMEELDRQIRTRIYGV